MAPSGGSTPLSILFALGLSALAPPLASTAAPAIPSPHPTGFKSDPADSLAPFLDRHCLECHDSDSRKGNLDLSLLIGPFAGPDAIARWTDIHDRISSGEMPPVKQPRPDSEETDAALAHIATSLRAADLAHRRIVPRRLNREQHQNTVNDLFGINVSLKERFPKDPEAHGFDTIGEALSLSPNLMALYLEAADVAVSAALQSGPRPKSTSVIIDPISMREFYERYAHLFQEVHDGLALFGRAMINLPAFRAPQDGIYRIRIHARTFHPNVDPVILHVRSGDVISQKKERRRVGFYEVKSGSLSPIEFECALRRNDTLRLEGYKLGPFLRGKPTLQHRGLVIGKIEIEGPIIAEWPPPSRRNLLETSQPESDPLARARDLLRRIVPRAFRRPIAPEEIQPYMTLIADALDRGDNFEDACRTALKALLCSPEFLFIGEHQPLPSNETELPPHLDPYELASRLSYFLWNSTPDEELFRLAGKDALRDPPTLRRQVERLLNHSKSAAFLDSFTGQWLDLRSVNESSPDPKLFPEYDALLEVSIPQETQRFFHKILAKDLSVLNFIDSDFLILNERLAQHYGIPGVQGLDFREVALPPDSPRGGVLTQASILKLTSNGTTTSPVRRGVWILENILGNPPPPPPAVVADIEPDIRGTSTVREQLEKHRDVPSCQRCHSRIDPLGFALESFDPAGSSRLHYRIRRKDGSAVNGPDGQLIYYEEGPPVDPRGTLPDGRSFPDISSLKKLLLDDPHTIAHCLAEKLLTYALGRPLTFSDRNEVTAIVERAKTRNYGFRSLIHETIQSNAFRRCIPASPSALLSTSDPANTSQ